ncbi:hypothetical protein SAY86_027414 [Trapa natans]|uniref:Uncharacterized protein n=1 Tax=Trapa natans TaxID=22666 RepID=A0AAN7QJ42_TRANT|nr:hypothetical protein SAY86_027414 [Trapa natans]
MFKSKALLLIYDLRAGDRNLWAQQRGDTAVRNILNDIDSQMVRSLSDADLDAQVGRRPHCSVQQIEVIWK